MSSALSVLCASLLWAPSDPLLWRALAGGSSAKLSLFVEGGKAWSQGVGQPEGEGEPLGSNRPFLCEHGNPLFIRRPLSTTGPANSRGPGNRAGRFCISVPRTFQTILGSLSDTHKMLLCFACAFCELHSQNI